MATLSQLHNVQSGSLKKVAPQVQQLAQGNQIPLPPPPSTTPPPVPQDQTPTGADNQDDLLAQIANALYGAAGSRGGSFKGSSGSSQAQTNLGLDQTTALLNATAANQKANFGLLAESLQNKLGYSDTNYQQNLQALAQQYGASLFNQGSGAAASGSGVSVGNRFALGQLGESNALQQAMLGSQHTLADSQIVEAQKKAYANALLANTKLGQAWDMNQLQRQEAGLAPGVFG